MTRRRQGRRARDAGQRWEEWITLTAQGVALFRTQPEVKPVRAETGIRYIRTAEGVGVPDFIACVDGQMVAAEAKRRQGERLPWSAVTPRQAERLQAVEDAGGLSVLLVSLGGCQPPRSCLVVPWRVVLAGRTRYATSRSDSTRAARGAASATVEELLEAGALPMGSRWTDAVRRLLEGR